MLLGVFLSDALK